MDYTGAITLLEFEAKSKQQRSDLLEWLSYSYMHNGDFRKAMEVYDKLLEKDSSNHEFIIYKALYFWHDIFVLCFKVSQVWNVCVLN